MPSMTSSLRQINALDLAICLRFNRLSRLALPCLLFRGISRLGNGMFWYSLMGTLLILDPGAGPVVMRMMAGGLLCLAIYKWLKAKTSRPRPYQVYVAIAAAAPALDRFSFPSGHTLHAVCFSWIAGHFVPGLAPLLWGFTALVAASRPILGLHYPSDVIAGALIGLGVAELMLLI